MVPRVHVTFADINSTYDELINIFREDKFTRLPIYEDTTDNVVGTINMKDLLLYDNTKEFHIRDILRDAYFTYEYKNISELLVEMREAKFNIAIVLDEYGETAGLITLEDILEEIVGEIHDEYDEDEQQFIRLADGSLIFEAKILLTDFFRVIDADPSDFGKLTEEVETLAGLLLEIKGDFPRRREIIDFKEYRFQVLEVDNRRILKVKFNRILEDTGNDENGKDTK